MGPLAIGGKAVGAYVRFVRWLDRHWDTILEIIICIMLFSIGLASGVFIAIARL